MLARDRVTFRVQETNNALIGEKSVVPRDWRSLSTPNPRLPSWAKLGCLSEAIES
jgi:hypothetical protein